MRKRLTLTLAMLAVAGLLAPPATAQIVNVLDCVGYGWETGGFRPSNLNDVLEIVAAADYADATILGYDLGTAEVTFYAYGLLSGGQVVGAQQALTVGYTGGTLEIWQDAAMNADFGLTPPNATAPATFADGTLLFRGSFTDFVLDVDRNDNGSFVAHVNIEAGLWAEELCSDCTYTWSGTWTKGGPSGYDGQLDAILEVDQAVANGDLGWGALKAQY